ncbi:hypothetical protein KA107_02525 [Candidatus Pacearchaeota archaeon]|nr:hypothetical protein [Candidatus Pacearchaeota archaeon]
MKQEQLEKPAQTKGRYIHYIGGLCTEIYGYTIAQVVEVKKLLGERYPDYIKWRDSFKEITSENTKRTDSIDSLWCADWEKKVRWEQLMYVNPLPNIICKISPYEVEAIQKLWQEPERMGSLYVYRNVNTPWGIETTLAVPKKVAIALENFDWKTTLKKATEERREIDAFRKAYAKIAHTVIPGWAVARGD